MRASTLLWAAPLFAMRCAATRLEPTPPDAGIDDAAPVFVADAAASGDAATCDPPDMLVVLDRTESMATTAAGYEPKPDGGIDQTKWVIACNAIKGVAVAGTDQTLRFGLEVFPQNPRDLDDASTSYCTTLEALLSGKGAQNPSCQAGEVVVEPALGTSGEIAALLDPLVMPLCGSSPIANAMQTAQVELSKSKGARKQYVVLVTDGGETCAGGTEIGGSNWDTSADVSVTQLLASLDIKTFVVGFGLLADAGLGGAGGGVNVSLLNDMACAGMTATNFATACKMSGTGYVAVDPKGAPLFAIAQDEASLQSAVGGVASSVCCGCVN